MQDIRNLTNVKPAYAPQSGSVLDKSRFPNCKIVNQNKDALWSGITCSEISDLGAPKLWKECTIETEYTIQDFYWSKQGVVYV